MKKDTTFFVWTRWGKTKEFKELGDLPNYYTKNDLEDCSIQVLYGCTVVGYLNTENVLEEVYHEVN